MGHKISKVNRFKSELVFEDNTKLNFDYLFNCSGLQSDRLAHKFEIGLIISSSFQRFILENQRKSPILYQQIFTLCQI